jgi:hypothetical protein
VGLDGVGKSQPAPAVAFVWVPPVVLAPQGLLPEPERVLPDLIAAIGLGHGECDESAAQKGGGHGGKNANYVEPEPRG